MEKSKALQLIGSLSRSAILRYQTQESRSINKPIAIATELHAAKEILIGLGIDASKDEIREALDQ